MPARLSALVLLLLLGACQETQLEPTPEALTRRAPNVCPGDHLSPGETVSGDWGSATGVSTGVNYEVNAGWTITVCSKGGPDYNIATITGEASGFLETPEGPGGNIPALSHFSITDITPPEPSPTTTTTSVDETTTTEGGVTTTSDSGDTTQPEAGASTTTVPETTSTPEAATTLTTGGEGGGSIPLEGSTTTIGPQGTTTIDPDQSTIAGSGQEGTGEGGVVGSGQEGSGGTDQSQDTLAYTGAEEAPLAGLALSLIATGLLLALLLLPRADDQ